MDVRRRGLAHDTAQDRAWVELPDVQHPPKLPPFEPKISSKSFVGTLTGDYHLVALLLHFTREREQRGTRSVEHRTLSGLDKPRIVAAITPALASRTVCLLPIARAVAAAPSVSSNCDCGALTVKLGIGAPLKDDAVARMY